MVLIKISVVLKSLPISLDSVSVFISIVNAKSLGIISDLSCGLTVSCTSMARGVHSHCVVERALSLSVRKLF